MYYTEFSTELCGIILAGDQEGLKHLHLKTGDGKREFAVEPGWRRDDDFFSGAITQIKDFLSGARKGFDLMTAPEGTDFQKKVWSQLQEIPYGETRSYADIAATLGNPGAARAVGAANGKNPIPLIIPCHRVCGSSGALTGYAFGLKTKEKLLRLERSGRLHE